MPGNGLELGQGIHNSKMSSWLGDYGVLWRFKLIIYALVSIYVIGLALLVAGLIDRRSWPLVLGCGLALMVLILIRQVAKFKSSLLAAGDKTCKDESSCSNGCAAGSTCGDRLEKELQLRASQYDARQLSEAINSVPRFGLVFFASWPTVTSIAALNGAEPSFMLAAAFLWIALMGFVIVRYRAGRLAELVGKA